MIINKKHYVILNSELAIPSLHHPKYEVFGVSTRISIRPIIAVNQALLASIKLWEHVRTALLKRFLRVLTIYVLDQKIRKIGIP